MAHRFIHTISGTGDVAGAVPANNFMRAGCCGYVTGIEVRLATGASVTSLLPYVWRGQHLVGATVPDEERIFEATAATTGAPLTASATDRQTSNRFEPEPFTEGVTPAVDVLATGAWELAVTVMVDLDTVEN